MAGTPYGKEFCDEYGENDPSWSQDTVYKCYLENKVIDAQEYCDYIFDKEDDISFDAKKLIACYVDFALPKNEKYCKYNYVGNSTEIYDLRI
jgi:hypothetical protein